ncbi:MAG: AbrB/MazE/SpoVT family DNA-binding domain-containing protein [Promethearchaeota archaeon]|nr:MAG: AbrB/MazE/SpoVT family DNA-binding domain-containing protein [Candidatus Lokiarchaeota archaeon]
MHMAEIMAHTTKLDKQGRLIIPAEIRKKLSLSEDSVLIIEILGNQLIIKKKMAVSKEQREDWKKKLKNMEIRAFTEEYNQNNESTKWMSEEYVRNKLGL